MSLNMRIFKTSIAKYTYNFIQISKIQTGAYIKEPSFPSARSFAYNSTQNWSRPRRSPLAKHDLNLISMNSFLGNLLNPHEFGKRWCAWSMNEIYLDNDNPCCSTTLSKQTCTHTQLIHTKVYVHCKGFPPPIPPYILTLIECPSGMTVNGVQQSADNVTPASNDMIRSHEVERHNGQEDPGISCINGRAGDYEVGGEEDNKSIKLFPLEIWRTLWIVCCKILLTN